MVASSLVLSDVLGAIVDQLGAITEHTGASVVLFKDDEFEFAEARSITGTGPRSEPGPVRRRAPDVWDEIGASL